MTTENATSAAPTGELSLRVLAMPADTNPAGNIFGGWALGQMDMAGAMHAASYVAGRVATVAVDAMKFHKPVFVGDEVSCYTSIMRVGRTSVATLVQMWVRRARHGEPILVTEGVFTYVAMDERGQKTEIKKNA